MKRTRKINPHKFSPLGKVLDELFAAMELHKTKPFPRPPRKLSK